MPAARSITIVGGGLAGLTLGIALRRREIPVRLHEAGHYPRHRVCGEFISGRGQASLVRLGLQDVFTNAGAVSAGTAAFFSATRPTPPRALPSAAMCLSRFALDVALAARFQELGGELLAGKRWLAENDAEGVVRATGRQAQVEQGNERWFGLKIHAQNVPLTADLEMHVLRHGYVGLCQLANGEVNICGLFHRRSGEHSAASNLREWLHGEPGSILRKRLAVAHFDDRSFCAVAGISLRPQRAVAHAEVCIGDAITMIPPVTGNGMSMAFESAELAVAPLVGWSCGDISWAEARRQIANRCDAAFASRLRWAKWLQRCLLTPAFHNPLVAVMSRSEWLWQMAFERTR